MANAERITIAVASETVGGDNISCANCVGACCVAGTGLELTKSERDFLREGGTELAPYRHDMFDKVRVGLGIGSARFVMESDCGFLSEPNETGQRDCTAYEDPSRPEVCDSMGVGSTACQAMRTKAGL